MSADRAAIEALVQRQADAWLAGDPDAVVADFAPDGALISPGGRWQGREAIGDAVRAFLRDAAVEAIEVRTVLVDGEAGAVEWVWTERRHADGRRVTMEDAIVFRVRDGALVYWREYFDPAQERPLP